MNRLFDVGALLDSFSSPVRQDPEELFCQRRKGWHMGRPDAPEPRVCLDDPHPHMLMRGITAHANWKRGIYGPTLTELKADRGNVGRIAPGVAALIRRLLGDNLHLCGWAVAAPPPRRHKDWNFALATGGEIAALLGIPFYCDVAKPPRTRQRIGVEYELDRLPVERNIIVFDDICTTGSTLVSMGRLLAAYSRTVFNVVAVDNK